MTDYNLEIRLKKILYRSLNRGCRENDIILGNFARHCLHNLSEENLNDFENLLEESDDDLFGWITGKLPISKKWQNNALLFKIIEFSSCK